MSNKVLKSSVWALTSLLGALYLLWVLFPASTETTNPRIITVNHIRTPLGWTLLGLVFLALVVGVWALARKIKIGWLPIALVLGCPVLCCLTIWDDAGAHESIAEVTAPDGRKYHLLLSAFLQGKEVVIARLESDSLWQGRYRVLSSASGEHEFGFLGVVRPAENTATPQLYISPDLTLLGAEYMNIASVAYNLRSQKSYTDLTPDRTANQGHISELSPFLLLGPTSRPLTRDFESLMDIKSYGRPRRSAISEDLKNANPLVREMASKLDASLKRHPSPNED